MKKIATIILSIICILSLGQRAYAAPSDQIIVPIQAKLDAGNFKVVLQEADNLALSVDVHNDRDELESAILSDDDKAVIAGGLNVVATFLITPVDYKEVKTIVEAISPISPTDKAISFDITIVKSETEEEAEGSGQLVSNTNEPIVFSFNAPNDFSVEKADEVKLLCIHEQANGSYLVSILPVNYDQINNKLSFATNMFSKYVLSYPTTADFVEGTPIDLDTTGRPAVDLSGDGTYPTGSINPKLPGDTERTPETPTTTVVPSKKDNESGESGSDNPEDPPTPDIPTPDPPKEDDQPVTPTPAPTPDIEEPDIPEIPTPTPSEDPGTPETPPTPDDPEVTTPDPVPVPVPETDKTEENDSGKKKSSSSSSSGSSSNITSEPVATYLVNIDGGTPTVRDLTDGTAKTVTEQTITQTSTTTSTSTASSDDSDGRMARTGDSTMPTEARVGLILAAAFIILLVILSRKKKKKE